MDLLDCIGNEDLNVTYYTSIDYSRVPGKAIFINSNLILSEQAVSAREGLYCGGRARGDNAQHSRYLGEHSGLNKGSSSQNLTEQSLFCIFALLPRVT